MFDVTITTELAERDIEWILESMDAEYDEDTDIVSFEFDGEMHDIYSEYVAAGIEQFCNENYEELGMGFTTSIEALSNNIDDVDILKSTIVELAEGG